MAAYFNIGIVALLAVSIDCFCNVKAQRCKESEFFYSVQIASNDLSGRTHTRTDNCKISTMMTRRELTSFAPFLYRYVNPPLDEVVAGIVNSPFLNQYLETFVATIATYDNPAETAVYTCLCCTNYRRRGFLSASKN